MTQAAPPAPKSAMTAAERKRMIAERCERSLTWRIIHMLGSLHLALILLATIAIACAVATFAESGFSTKIAQAYIYKAPWFVLWLFVLCVNLLAVTLTRWPWQKKHTGFITTHYGIIILLVGSMIGLHTGFEGNVTLKKDQPPVSRITTNRSIIQLESPADTYLYIKPFDAEVTRPSASRPRVFPVPGTDLRIVANDFAPSLVREPVLVSSTTPGSGPGILLRMTSKMANQNLLVPLHLPGTGEFDFFGMANIRLHEKLPATTLAGPAETRMVFAKFAPVSSGGSSEVLIRLSEDGKKVSFFDKDGYGATYSREEIMGKPISEAGVTIVVEEYWPDFSMENGKPSSKSNLPNNPAIIARISTKSEETETKPALDFQVEGDTANFRLTRDGLAYASGAVKPGGKFSLGWADWEAEAIAVLPSSTLAHEVKPGEPTNPNENPVPGFRARLEGPDGKSGPERWVESGEITSLTDGLNVVRIGYGLETKPMPFSMRLLRFDVPRDEGTESPSNFLATVEFRDSKTGETKTGVAQMNRPASFPGTLWANLTGINYKFSQAEWNPRDLDQTTLQVLYDPGWLLKWIGSLLICVGIAIQFYWKPKS